MREIKFRVWDNVLKYYVDDGFITFRLTDHIVIQPMNDRIVEQFTGETDKNGKEIYEGDILARKYGGKWVVEFDEGSFVYRCIESTMAVGWEEVIGNIHENGDLLK